MMRTGAALLIMLTVTMLLAAKVAITIVMRKQNLSNGAITLKNRTDREKWMLPIKTMPLIIITVVR